MKKIILFFLLITALTGCGLNQNTSSNNGNGNKTESNAISPATATGSSTSGAENSKAVKKDDHLITAKQALSAGEYVKAIEEANVSIKDNANNAEAYSVRGFATALNGDAAKGLTDTKKAYDLDPNNVANYYNMAMVYKLQGQLNDSKQWFVKVL